MVLPPDDPAEAQAWIRGDPTPYPDAIVDFYIPRGNVGPIGPRGPMGPSLIVGDVETNMGPAAPGTVGPQGLPGAKGDPGGLTVTYIVASTDLNNLTTPGLYGIGNGALATLANNFPTSATAACTILVYRYDPNDATRIIQEVTYFTNGPGQSATIGKWMRSSRSGWSQWSNIATNRVAQTAGRAIYQWDYLNQREQMIYGDTGWRDVSADAAWVSAFTSGTDVTIANNLLSVRRIEQRVDIVWGVNKPTVGTFNMTSPIPTGFRSFHVYNAAGYNSSVAMLRAYLAGSTSPIAIQGTQSGGAYTFNMSYTTLDTWPSTLPGIDYGGIPNN